MKIDELRQKTVGELKTFLNEERDRMRDERFNLYSGKKKNIKIIHDGKLLISRIMTVIREKG